MAILDTFYILFKSNSKDAEKGFKSVNDSIVRMDHSLNKFARKWLSLYAVFTGLTNAVSYAFDLTQASQALAVNVEELDAWGSALKRTGGNVESFSKVLESLSTHLGASPKTALQLLPKIADQFSRLSRIQALQYGKLIGLDTPTILLLQQGRREVEAMIARQKELGVVTSRDALIFKKFQENTQDLNKSFQSLARDYLLKIIPIIDIALEKIIKFIVYIRKHSGLVKGALIPVAAVFFGIAASIIAANAPLFAFIGAIALLSSALALAYDDFQIFKEGGKSAIGAFLNKFPELERVGKKTFDVISDALEKFIQKLNTALEKLNTFISKILEISTTWLEPKLKPFNDYVLYDLLGFEGGKYSGNGTGFALGSARKAIDLLNNVPSSFGRSPPLFNTPSGGGRDINLTINDLQINTAATDAYGIASAIGTELERQMRQLQNNIAGGQLI